MEPEGIALYKKRGRGFKPQRPRLLFWCREGDLNPHRG